MLQKRRSQKEPIEKIFLGLSNILKTKTFLLKKWQKNESEIEKQFESNELDKDVTVL